MSIKIYVIEDMREHRIVYVGQTSSRLLCQRNLPHTKQFQDYLAATGRANISRYVIDEVEDQDLADALEKYYIEKYDTANTGYNVELGGKSGFITKNSKEIYQLDKAGNIINKFQTLGQASDYTNITKGNISKALNGKRASAGGFTWKYIN